MGARDGLSDAWAGTLRRGDPMTPPTPWLVPPTITGPSVVLRATRDADLARLVEGANDPEVQKYSQTLRERAPHDEATMRERELSLQEESAAGGSVSWVVADAETDELLGWIALFHLHAGSEAEIGYWSHPAARGRGAMVHACQMVVRHAFIDEEDGGLGMRRLTANIATVNPASQRVAERAGFVRIGRERRSTLLGDGTYVDALLYDRLADGLTS